MHVVTLALGRGMSYIVKISPPSIILLLHFPLSLTGYIDIGYGLDAEHFKFYVSAHYVIV